MADSNASLIRRARAAHGCQSASACATNRTSLLVGLGGQAAAPMSNDRFHILRLLLCCTALRQFSVHRNYLQGVVGSDAACAANGSLVPQSGPSAAALIRPLCGRACHPPLTSHIASSEGTFRRRDRIHAGRNTCINGNLQDDLNYLFACYAGVEGGADVKLQLPRSRTHGGQHGDCQHRPCAQVDPRLTMSVPSQAFIGTIWLSLRKKDDLKVPRMYCCLLPLDPARRPHQPCPRPGCDRRLAHQNPDVFCGVCDSVSS